MYFANNHNSRLDQIFIVIITLTLAHLRRQWKHAFSPKQILQGLQQPPHTVPKYISKVPKDRKSTRMQL